MRVHRSTAFAILATLLVACGGGPATSFRHENTPDNLKALGQELKRAAAGDEKTALAFTKALLPDDARLRKGLKDDVASDAVQKLAGGLKELSADESRLAKAFAVDPAQTEIQVHAATTEQLVAYESGSTAFNEFPGGARTLAEQVLRPGMTYYEMEYLKPGESSGMKFHLFYWDGSQWTMLGPMWRFLK